MRDDQATGKNYKPVTVPFAAKPAGEPVSIRGWANPWFGRNAC